MSPGERCTVVDRNFYGNTGTIVIVGVNAVAVDLDGRESDYDYGLFPKRDIVPESRNYDYDWQRERGLL